MRKFLFKSFVLLSLIFCFAGCDLLDQLENSSVTVKVDEVNIEDLVEGQYYCEITVEGDGFNATKRILIESEDQFYEIRSGNFAVDFEIPVGTKVSATAVIYKIEVIDRERVSTPLVEGKTGEISVAPGDNAIDVTCTDYVEPEPEQPDPEELYLYVTCKKLNAASGDTGNGSEEEPFACIQHAVNALAAKDNLSNADCYIVISGMDDNTLYVAANGTMVKIPDNMNIRSLTLQGDDADGEDGIGGNGSQLLVIGDQTSTLPVYIRNLTFRPDGTGSSYYYEEFCGGANASTTRSNVNRMNLIRIGSYTEVTMTDVDIDGSSYYANCTNRDNDTVYVGAHASLTLEGTASIHDFNGYDVSGYRYGTVFISRYGNFYMKGNSSIYNCKAEYGGAVFVRPGAVFEMSGSSKIGDDGKGCEATSYGGAVYIEGHHGDGTSPESGGKFVMSDSATISYCNSANGGDGIHLKGGIFTIKDSASVRYNGGDDGYEIDAEGNQTSYSDDYSIVNIEGGSIYSNAIRISGSSSWNAPDWWKCIPQLRIQGNPVIYSTIELWAYNDSDVPCVYAGRLTGSTSYPYSINTPMYKHKDGTKIITVLDGSGVDIADAVTHFKLTDTTGYDYDEETSPFTVNEAKKRKISDEGRLKTVVNAQYYANLLSSATGPVDLVITGTMDSDNLNELAAVLKNSAQNFTLDLTGVTGLTEFGGFSSVTKLTSITLPEGITKISSEAFYCCNGLVNVILPDTVTEIGSYAFYNCPNLESVNIPDGVTSIQSSTFFADEKLKTITIPAGVTSIASDAFGFGTVNSGIALEDIILASGNTSYTQVNGIIYTSDMKTLVTYCTRTDADRTEIEIPASVEKISDYAFAASQKLTKITFASGGNLTSIGIDAFVSCSNISEMIIPDSVTEIGSGCFFWALTADCNFSLPAHLKKIPFSCFWGASIQNLVIPDEVEEIESCAFKSSDIKTITLPKSLKKIGDNIFVYSSDPANYFVLTTVNYKGSEEDRANMTINETGNTKFLSLTWNYNYTGE